ncbi:hypothetical protein [Deinococcus marmoris]|uniref:hypothetical protein n=1 Tax=Deinococcus marmoris TaxID=249408 RepID=UPI0012DE28E1|nr:hypothetical protein [Deinococcus marmoris]
MGGAAGQCARDSAQVGGLALHSALEVQEEGAGLRLKFGQFMDRLHVRTVNVEGHALRQRDGVGVAVGFDPCLSLLNGGNCGLPLVTDL